MQSRYAADFKMAMAMRPDREIDAMKERLIAQMKSIQNSENPDKEMFKNYKWQLNMVNAELNRRHPKPAERLEQIAEDTPKTESFSESLKHKTIEELIKLITDIKESMKAGGNAESIDLRNEQIHEIEQELSGRDKPTEEKAKADVQKAVSKFAITAPMIKTAAVGAVAGAAVAMIFKKNIWWGLGIGAAVGAGYNIIKK